MSRLGKKPIELPAGVEVEIRGDEIRVKGPKGELSRHFLDSLVKIRREGNAIILEPAKQNRRALMLWGTYASHIQNMLYGVVAGFCKTLIIEGVGYKAAIEGKNLVLNLGFSHPVSLPVPEGVEIKVEKNRIEVCGIDKEQVGQTAARIRSFKKPEPYKGKGIRYEDEVIRRKAGKKAVGVM
jgi:large subunit ribosomal protein L6